MKIAHIADAHWGLGYPGPDPYSRFEDICRVMDWAADKMIEEKVDICLFAGDAFKDSKVMLDRARVEIAAFLGWIQKISEAGISPVIISGTPSHDAVDAYKLLDRMVNEFRVHILTTPSLVDGVPWGGFDSERNVFVDGIHKINIACLPGLNRSAIASREEYQGKSPQEIHRIMAEKIRDITQGMLAARTDLSWPTILLSHMTYSAADTGFEHLLLEHEPLLTPEAVDGYDLVCLGHIHKAQMIKNHIFYSGAPERHSFNDEHVTPGFWIHTLPGLVHPVESRFVETPARKFITLDPVAEDLQIADGIWCHGRQVDVTDAIVRIRCKATEEEAKLLDRRIIERAFHIAGAFHVAEIAIDVERTDRTRDASVTESLAPLSAVEKWGEQQGLDPEEIQVLVGMSNELIEAEAMS